MAHQVDVDHSGSLDLREFILCMRKVREVELKAVKSLGKVSESSTAIPKHQRNDRSFGMRQGVPWMVPWGTHDG